MTTEDTGTESTDIVTAGDVKKLLGDSALVRFTAERMQSMAVEEVARAKQDLALLQRTGAKWVTAAEPRELATFVRAAVSVGLNVLVGDVYLIHGGFYPSIQGRRKLAGNVLNRAGDPVMRGESPPRALTDAEFTLHGVRDDDIARIIDVFRSDRDIPSQGVGIVRGGEIEDARKSVDRKTGVPFLPLGNSPEFMAAKRAAAAAYRVAFPDLSSGTADFDDGGRLVASDVTGVEIVEAVAAPPSLPAGDETLVGGADEVPSDGTEPDGEETAAQAQVRVICEAIDAAGLGGDHPFGCTPAEWLELNPDADVALSLLEDIQGMLAEHEGMDAAEAISRTHAAHAAHDLPYHADAVIDNTHMSEAAAQPKLPE